MYLVYIWKENILLKGGENRHFTGKRDGNENFRC